MTRKQYRKKVRHLQRNIARFAKENGLSRITGADRVQIPNFGKVICSGRHEGQILRSYAQCWDMLSDALSGTVAMKDIP